MAFLRGATNFVQDQLFSNCQRPFYIYVLTAIPCLVEAVITYKLFDSNDLVRAAGWKAASGGRPGKRTIKHGRTKQARKVPGTARERYYKRGLHHLMVLTQPLEFIGFHLLLYGVVDRFYSNWMYLLDEADACIRPDFYGPLIRRTTNGDAHPNSGGNVIQLPELVRDGAGWGSSSIGASLPVGRYKAIFAATVTGPGGGATYKLAVRATGVLGSGNFESEPVFCEAGTDTDIVCVADIFVFSAFGSSVTWVISGPSVPVGLRIPKADIYIQRRATATQDIEHL